MGKFGDCSFSHFSFIVRSNRQTDTHRITDAAKHFTPWLSSAWLITEMTGNRNSRFRFHGERYYTYVLTCINEFSKKLIPWLFICRERVGVAPARFHDASPTLSELDTLITREADTVPQAFECGVDLSEQATDASVMVDRGHLTGRRHVVIRLQRYTR